MSSGIKNFHSIRICTNKFLSTFSFASGEHPKEIFLSNPAQFREKSLFAFQLRKSGIETSIFERNSTRKLSLIKKDIRRYPKRSSERDI